MSDKTPSGRIVAAANREMETTDARGRKIRIRRLGALDRARLFKAIGSDNSQNAPYLGMAMLVASATEMDGVPTLFPSTDQQIEALIARFEDDGMNAIAAKLVEVREAETAAQMEQQEAEAAVKRAVDAGTETQA